MKKTVLCLCFVCASILATAQGGANREPAGVNRSPAGAKSGREGGNGGSNRDGKEKTKEKDGKKSVSDGAKATAKDIKAANSLDGKGRNMTETQRSEAARQLGNEQARAAANGKKADAKFFEKEKDKLKGKH